MVMFASGSAIARSAIRTSVSELMSESMSKLVDKGMTKLERTRFLTLLEHMKEHDSISSADAALALGVDRKTASRLLSRAETLGVMTSDGKTKNKTYKMSEPAARRPEIGTSVSELMSESMSKLVDKGMTKLERTRFLILLEYMKEHDSISSAEAALALGVDRKAASRLLRRAEALGVMTSDGKTKNKKYRMI